MTIITTDLYAALAEVTGLSTDEVRTQVTVWDPPQAYDPDEGYASAIVTVDADVYEVLNGWWGTMSEKAIAALESWARAQYGLSTVEPYSGGVWMVYPE